MLEFLNFAFQCASLIILIIVEYKMNMLGLTGWMGEKDTSDPFDLSSYEEDKRSLVLKLHQKLSDSYSISDIMRFLIARDFNEEITVEMIRQNMLWRAENLPISKASFPNELQVGKMFYLGKAKDGRSPVIYWNASLHDPETRDVDEVVRYIVWWVTYATTQLSEGDHQIITILDRSEMTRTSLDTDFFTAVNATMSNNFPERMSSVVIYPLNWVFRSIWQVLKNGFFFC